MSSPGLITELNDTVDALQAKIERLRASNAELLAALEKYVRDFGGNAKARAAISHARRLP